MKKSFSVGESGYMYNKVQRFFLFSRTNFIKFHFARHPIALGQGISKLFLNLDLDISLEFQMSLLLAMLWYSVMQSDGNSLKIGTFPEAITHKLIITS